MSPYFGPISHLQDPVPGRGEQAWTGIIPVDGQQDA